MFWVSGSNKASWDWIPFYSFSLFNPSLGLCQHLIAFSNFTYLRPVTILTNNNRESSNP